MLSRMSTNSRVPAVVVSGFLGSGKTTLVRHLLADAQRSGRRAAVVSNEFGALGIDGALLSNATDDYVELAGGCVCCRLSDELVETLQMLRERVNPDLVIVETSGIALPFDVQLNFWREPIADWIETDVVVVVVNAEQLANKRDLDGTFAQQVSSADLLLLNKLDLVAEGVLPELESKLREIEPDAPLVRTIHAQLDPALLFPPDPDGVRERRRSEPSETQFHHHEEFFTEELAAEEGVEPNALVERVRALAPLRAKGYVVTSEGPRILQGVGPRIELTKLDFSPPRELLGRIVVIRRSEP
jgi:cobalamin biosynthesis protein CobW